MGVLRLIHVNNALFAELLNASKNTIFLVDSSSYSSFYNISTFLSFYFFN